MGAPRWRFSARVAVQAPVSRFVRVGLRVHTESHSILVFPEAARWSRGVILTPGSYSAKSKALLVVIIRREGYLQRVGRGRGNCWTFCLYRTAPQRRILRPQMSSVLRVRNSKLGDTGAQAGRGAPERLPQECRGEAQPGAWAWTGARPIPPSETHS